MVASASACMHTVHYSYSTDSSIFNIRTVVLILVYITITGNILRSRVVATVSREGLTYSLVMTQTILIEHKDKEAARPD